MDLWLQIKLDILMAVYSLRITIANTFLSSFMHISKKTKSQIGRVDFPHKLNIFQAATFICWLGDCNTGHWIFKRMIKKYKLVTHLHNTKYMSCLLQVYYQKPCAERKFIWLCYVKISDVRSCKIDYEQENFLNKTS